MSFLDISGFTHFWENLRDDILPKKQDVLNGKEGQTVIFNSSGTMEAADRNEPIYTDFTGIQVISGISSIGDKMTYAVGMRDGANLMTFGQLHSYINATIKSSAADTEQQVANTTVFSFSLLSDGFSLSEPKRITGMTTAYITPNMTYPMQYTISGVENGMKIECEIFAVIPDEVPVNFNLLVPMIYIGAESDSITIQSLLDEAVANAIRSEY